MKIHDLKNKEGVVCAFEVSNILLRRRAACRIVRSIPGVKLVRRTRNDQFCQFELDGVTFVLWEPWGDSSRYWVGPEPPRPVDQLALVRREFARWHPFAGLVRWFARMKQLFAGRTR
jgi:hypothetical protein